ncbi:MAG: bifunctional [glutamine synthetase] adenylyltransferase/[glutamine synthetase]-adenylyl-L-tyrosine phosphorylase [Proteobacteria bacterium]|nr:bifunctional [glutamine synthetase] adenylyltransferase/[glutamine synthetase]-adenylyl-L-tyrosine phosphorylase [Pseudomonadota bacterium]
MHGFSLVQGEGSLPQPHNRKRAEASLEDFVRAAGADAELRDFAQGFANRSDGRALLRAIFGNSPFLSLCILRDIGFVRDFVSQGLDKPFEALLAGLNGPPPPRAPSQEEAGPSRKEFAAQLRRAKARAALLIAVADLAGLWSLTQVTAALSRFAEGAIGAAVDFLLAQAQASGALGDRGGYVILAMGKLGARELNYSSDIDLIALFDPERVDYRGKKTAQDLFVRLTQDLVQLLQDRTEDGYVFRTDLRLRPDAGATPVALSTVAAETYYESVGQNWERAAMIKARQVAGDASVGNDFLRHIAPFVWRKHLDFAAIADIHSIKRQIDVHRGYRTVTVPGHNIKLGPGGIREIEFFAQTQQLIAGGRDPSLRDPTTCGAISALRASGRLEQSVADELIAAYTYLRRLEHRLQMIADEQTQTLPQSDEGMKHVATFMGYESVDLFAEELLGHMNRVREHYGNLFEDSPTLGSEGNLVFTGPDDDPATLETLTGMGFHEAKTVAGVMRRWHHGRYRATRSERARQLLTALAPHLLKALAATANPDAAFTKFDEFLGNLPEGVQLFSLFHSNPGLLDLVAEIMGTAPRLAEYLSRNSSSLDSVLSEGFFDPMPPKSDLARGLSAAIGEARDFQDVLDIARRWNRERVFQAGVRVLRGSAGADSIGAVLTDLAEIAIEALLPHVEEQFAAQHGRLGEAGFAIVGMGKLGSREMMFGSDLDLVFLYDTPGGPRGPDSSSGARPLSTSQYFARLSQRLINALSALTAEGRLYEIDMRLRPSGAAGPIAVHIDGFEQYQHESAWIWERMALTRARVITATPRLGQRIGDLLTALLRRECDTAELAGGVDDMRQRVEREYPAKGVWDLKYVRGGLLDLEFLCQYFQLRFAHEHPQVRRPGTVAALRALGEAGCLGPELSARLAEDAVFLHDIYGLLRLCLSGEWRDETIPTGLGAALCRAASVADLDALKTKLARTQDQILAEYETWIGSAARDATG